ncbi:MAG: 4-phosphoerythronate dehydrogenase, partial [Gammaproteobacteria bacterium]
MLEGRVINPQQVRDADVLLVRSVTRIDAELLSGSTVRFVASATSGIDHVDVDYLQRAGIVFTHAPGCNAEAVVEYVLSSLFVLALQLQFRLADKIVGIIGCGQVGTRLARALTALGVRYLLNDPPLSEIVGGNQYSDLEEVLQADIITLHVPLTDAGRYPTRHLVNEQFLGQLKPGAILINTSRGGVVDESALRQILRQNHCPVVLDVWENEPDIDRELLAAVAIGTPHIAGYTIDARLRATEMIYHRLCEHLHLSGCWKPETVLVHFPETDVWIDAGVGTQDGLELAILSHYDVRSDAAALCQSRT